MRAGFLLFPFSPTDQARIDAPSIVVEDIGYAAAPVAGNAYPQAMRLTFRLTAVTPIPQIRPMFPGQMRFIPDPAAPGVTPGPDDVQFTPAAYAGWRTRGTLRLSVDIEAAQAMATLVPGPGPPRRSLGTAHLTRRPRQPPPQQQARQTATTAGPSQPAPASTPASHRKTRPDTAPPPAAKTPRNCPHSAGS